MLDGFLCRAVSLHEAGCVLLNVRVTACVRVHCRRVKQFCLHQYAGMILVCIRWLRLKQIFMSLQCL